MEAEERAQAARLPLLLVAAVALIDIDGRVLLARRPEGKSMAGLWEFPGGKIKTNETPDDTIVREVKEELSLEIDKDSLVPFSFNTYTYEKFHAIIFCYICRIWKGTPLSKNKQKVLWIEIEKLKNYEFLAGSQAFIQKLINLRKNIKINYL